MPLFDFQCKKCSKIDEQMHRYPRETSVCPDCGGESKRLFTTRRRNAVARTIWSKAMGVGPHQVKEMKKLYPHHNYNADGDLEVNGYQHQKRLAKELGMALH